MTTDTFLRRAVAVTTILGFGAGFLFFWNESNDRHTSSMVRAWEVIQRAKKIDGNIGQITALETLFIGNEDLQSIALGCPKLVAFRGFPHGSCMFLDRVDLRPTGILVKRPVNLTRAKLHGVNLFEALLDRAVLVRVKFHKANLRRANLKGALLMRAEFQDADLRETDFTGADISRAKFGGRISEYPLFLKGACFRPKTGNSKLDKYRGPPIGLSPELTDEIKPCPKDNFLLSAFNAIF